MLEFKGITFEKDYPDEAETWFYGASFENHINNVGYWCGSSFEIGMDDDINTFFMFNEI